MFKNRLFNLIVAALFIVVVALVTRQALATRANAPDANSVYTESKEPALREFQLGERYGQLPAHAVLWSAEQIRREYFLGERYGVTLQEYAEQQALREYWLGERYGQTP